MPPLAAFGAVVNRTQVSRGSVPGKTNSAHSLWLILKLKSCCFAHLLLKNSSPPLSSMFTVNSPPPPPTLLPTLERCKRGTICELPLLTCFKKTLSTGTNCCDCKLSFILGATADFVCFHTLGQSHIPMLFHCIKETSASRAFFTITIAFLSIFQLIALNL